MMMVVASLLVRRELIFCPFVCWTIRKVLEESGVRVGEKGWSPIGK